MKKLSHSQVLKQLDKKDSRFIVLELSTDELGPGIMIYTRGLTDIQCLIILENAAKNQFREMEESKQKQYVNELKTSENG